MLCTFTYANFIILFSVDQPAKESVWFVGDHFLRSNFQAYAGMFQQVKVIDGLYKPYVYDYYNVDFYWKSLSSRIHSPIGRVINSLIDAINGHATLPRFIVFTPDVDALRAMAYYQFRASLVIGKGLSVLINEVDTIIATRKAELKKCRTCSVVHRKPKFV